MIDPSRTVALVGRPNVGKSRLFNRLCGRRLAIVHDMPGVTRDVLSAEVRGDYRLLDTGGIGMELADTPEGIAAAAEEQVDFALTAASVVIFTVDAKEGPAPLDSMVAERLRRTGKPVIVAANKVDREADGAAARVFDSLGLGEALAVSAEHGTGLDRLEARLREALGPPPESGDGGEDGTGRKRLALVGRPNVGKSSIGNRLLNTPRLIVSEVPGTTRDAVELDLDYTHPDGAELHFRLADTAGIRSKRKVGSPVEYFSGVRTRHAIEHADVVYLVVDALDGVTRQDQALAGEVVEAGRALVVVVNKWDQVKARWEEAPVAGYDSLTEFLEAYEAALREELFFLPNPPVCFVSAATGLRMESLLEAAAAVEATLDMTLPTGRLNRVVREHMELRPPKLSGNKRFKVYYAVQTGARPIRIRVYCNRPERLDGNYRRYLEKAVIHEFRLEGCPVRFELVGKARRYAEGEAEDGPAPRQSKAEQDHARARKQGAAHARKKPDKERGGGGRHPQKKAPHNRDRKRRR